MPPFAAPRPARSHAPGRYVRAMVRDQVFAISGIPVHLAALAVLVVPVTVALAAGLKTGTAYSLLVLSVPAVLLVRAPLAAVQRHRCWSLLGMAISPVRTGGEGPAWRRARASIRSEATWRQIGYQLLAGPAFALLGLLTLGAWVGAAWLIGYCVNRADTTVASSKPGVLPEAVAAVVLIAAAPLLARAETWLDARAAPALLGPSRAVELEHRVERLTTSRAGVVDAADAERRRIERDLHDGAQQRLVALAMNLGIARETMPDLPDEVRQVIADAHEEAKEALTELRTLVRGLHPAVLEDRGLDAALSGIAARAPLPVRVSVDVHHRSTATVDAVAYFVVSECLANIAKHSQASSADVEVRSDGTTLLVRVSDDGVGGASPAGGTGLASLAQRAASVDGTLRLSSPPGGPTVVTVELPCGS
jgi:signal transduction histidine kinase